MQTLVTRMGLIKLIMEAVSRLVQDCRFVAEFNGVGTSERKMMGLAGRGDGQLAAA